MDTTEELFNILFYMRATVTALDGRDEEVLRLPLETNGWRRVPWAFKREDGLGDKRVYTLAAVMVALVEGDREELAIKVAQKVEWIVRAEVAFQPSPWGNAIWTGMVWTYHQALIGLIDVHLDANEKAAVSVTEHMSDFLKQLPENWQAAIHFP